MKTCPKCNSPMVLWKDMYDRFEHFFECEKCKSRYWMDTPFRKGCELTPEESHFIDGYMAKNS